MIDLKPIWISLVSTYSEGQEQTDLLWEEIESCYSDNTRYYHNLEHLRYMLKLKEELNSVFKDQEVVLFSIFYHDIIYNVKRQDNELKSAELAVKRLEELHFPTAKINACKNQIIATKEHLKSADHDTNYLLDLDLAILGDRPEKYANYVDQIRKEYAIYPDFLYKKGRKKVLKHFLKLDRIFKTDYFIANYENIARKNLENELSTL